MDLQNATVIVTGAGSGIGRVLAVEFARQGANVVCVGRRDDRLRETAKHIEDHASQALVAAADITDLQQVDHVMERTIEQFGAIDVLFNNAGSFQTLGAMWEVDPDDWWHDVTVNLRGPMLCSRSALKHMVPRDRGIVINMRGGDNIPGGSAYSCSKHAIPRLTQLLARELEAYDSAVLAFAMGPGFVHTEMTEPQISTQAGQYWLPSSSDNVNQGKDRDPQQCADKSVELISKAQPELNGQSFGPDTDIEKVLAQSSE